MKRLKPIWILVVLPPAFGVVMLLIGILSGFWDQSLTPAVVAMFLLLGLFLALPLYLAVLWGESPKIQPADLQRVHVRYSRINWYVSLAGMFGLGLFFGACFTAKASVVKLVVCAVMAPAAFIKMALLKRVEHLRSLDPSSPSPIAEPIAPDGRLNRWPSDARMSPDCPSPLHAHRRPRRR